MVNTARTFAAKIRKSVHRILLVLLPKNRMGDKIYAFVTFFRIHKRRPTKAKVFNDVLYQIKTSD